MKKKIKKIAEQIYELELKCQNMNKNELDKSLEQMTELSKNLSFEELIETLPFSDASILSHCELNVGESLALILIVSTFNLLKDSLFTLDFNFVTKQLFILLKFINY